MTTAAERRQQKIDQYQGERLETAAESQRLRDALALEHDESARKPIAKALRRSEKANLRAIRNLQTWTRGWSGIVDDLRELRGAAQAIHSSVMFGGLSFDGTVLSYQGQAQQAANARVLVETAGQLDRRMTLTRVAAGGLLFGPAGAVVGGLAKKKVDRRELYLLVDGDLYSWAVPVDPKHGAAARAFAAKVNTVSKVHAPAEA